MSHAINPNVMRRARDFYAVYCASSEGKNYQGLPCPAWDALTEAVRGHWYVVALRSLQLEGMLPGKENCGSESGTSPNTYVFDHLANIDGRIETWASYSGVKS